ncbi:MAG: CPBP family intramembrane glutamic endopeptidase [Bacteroidota bacterium]
MKIKNTIIIIVLPIILAIIIKSINIFSFICAESIYPSISFIDPDNSFLIISIHHIVQAFVAIVIIILYGIMRGIALKDFGFRKAGFIDALKWLKFFIVTWAIIQIISALILVNRFNQPIIFPFSLNLQNILGYLSFQMFLSGPSEELLFRVIVITILFDLTKNLLGKQGFNLYAICISTLIFMFDHINFCISPIGVAHFNVLQQITVMVFGVFYGWLFVKFKNYWIVALAHSALNLVIVLTSLILLAFQ